MKVELNDVTLASVHSLSVAASKDDVAPVITQIALKRDGDSLRAMATDRFMCLTGLYEGVAFQDWDEGQEVLVDPSSLKSMLDIKKKDKSNYNLTTTTISSEDDVVRGNMPDGTSVSLGLPNVKGSFPPDITRAWRKRASSYRRRRTMSNEAPAWIVAEISKVLNQATREAQQIQEDTE